MLVITGTRHSGTLFLSSTLQTAGLTAVSRKKALGVGKPPAGSMVAMPIPRLEAVAEKSDRVIGLVRPWRAWAAVMAEEDPNPAIPHEVSWWFDNYRMVCTLMRAKSRFLLLSHDRLLSRPEPSIQRVLRFLEREEALSRVLLLPAVAPSSPSYACRSLARDEQEVLDEYWQVIHRESAMTRRTFQRMSVLQDTLRRRYPDAGAIRSMAQTELQSKVPA